MKRTGRRDFKIKHTLNPLERHLQLVAGRGDQVVGDGNGSGQAGAAATSNSRSGTNNREASSVASKTGQPHAKKPTHLFLATQKSGSLHVPVKQPQGWGQTPTPIGIRSHPTPSHHRGLEHHTPTEIIVSILVSYYKKR